MANLRVLQKEQTRQRLLDTALELFESKGYSATTIDDIAVAAGTTRVTFYAHFASRRAIIAASTAAAVEPEIRDLVDEWSEEVVGDITDGLDLAERFEPATRHFRGVLAY